MYVEFVANASFWDQLLTIDRKLFETARASACSFCGGRLHTSHYPRKPRGLSVEAEPYFSQRFSCCCGHCRKRYTPSSVRFLGRRVYVAAIMILATMHTLVCGAARRTLGHWNFWWTQTVPTLGFWRELQGRLVPTVESSRLPGSLLERLEPQKDLQTEDCLVQVLKFLAPATTSTGRSRLFEGRCGVPVLAQKMHLEPKRRDPLCGSRALIDST